MFDVWKNVLAEVEQNISREQFVTWFPDTELIQVDNDVATIGVPNVFRIKQLEKKYFPVIQAAFEHNHMPVSKIEYVVRTKSKPAVRAAREVVMHRTDLANAGRAMGRKDTPTRLAQSLDNNLANLGKAFGTGLNPRYTLDNFVIGTNNDLAVSVARSIVDKPGGSYNPFFLYGGPGLGKTHLVQAIGNELLARDPSLKVLYTPISNFYADFINSVRANKGDEFHQKFKRLDVLIVDDFQMIVGKDQSQVEFFNIFNELYGLNKQIIVTSDRLPNQIKTMDERLASRLAWGGTFDIQLPKFEDKCAILKAKADFAGVEIEDEAIEYLAENVKTNIRDLEGEFNHLLAIADLKNMTPLEVINEGYINTARTASTKTISPRNVVEKVAKYYQLTPKELCSKSRVANIKNARQIAMYLLSKELGMSTTKIAAEVGVKDHTTVMHGVKKIDDDLKLNFILRDQLSALREEIYG